MTVSTDNIIIISILYVYTVYNIKQLFIVLYPIKNKYYILIQTENNELSSAERIKNHLVSEYCYQEINA